MLTRAGRDLFEQVDDGMGTVPSNSAAERQRKQRKLCKRQLVRRYGKYGKTRCGGCCSFVTSGEEDAWPEICIDKYGVRITRANACWGGTLPAKEKRISGSRCRLAGMYAGKSSCGNFITGARKLTEGKSGTRANKTGQTRRVLTI